MGNYKPADLPRLEWTLEQAEAADAQYREAHPACQNGDPGTPLFQWVALQRIDAQRPAIEAGDGFALLGAIRICANHDVTMPEWLARQFIRRYDLALNCRSGSWDDAFGLPYPKGTHLHALRKHREKRFAVYNAVRAAKSLDPDIAIGARLFVQVGEPLGIGKTLAEKLYYQAERMLYPKK
jgi:DNA-binding transcriptional LysR family regulator